MAFISITNTFTNGTSADATQVNTNFTDIVNGLSDGTKSINMDQGTFAGACTFNGNVTLGNGTGDDITITGSIAATVALKTNNSFDIGGASIGLAGVYLGAPSSRTTRITANQSLSGSNTLVLPNGGGSNNQVLQTDGSGNLRWIELLNNGEMTQNVGLSFSVGASALTIALKQSDCSTDASTGTSAVRIGFRSSTLTSGVYVTRSVTASLSMTVDSGATLGSTSNKAHRAYVYAIDNAGTVELAVSGSKLDENILYTTTTLDSNSDSAGVLYSDSSRSNVAIRLLGTFLHTQATAGTWASTPSEVYIGENYFSFAPTVSVSATYTATSLNEIILVDATSGAVTINLPTSSGLLGKKYKVIKTDSSTNTVTIDGSGSETINGSTTKVMYTQYEAYEILSDNSNWFVSDHDTITPWTSYTPTFTGFGTATSINVRWRRVGQSIEIEGAFTHGTCTAVENRITYPNSWNSASTIATLEVAGTMLYGANLGSIFALSILREASVQYMTVGYTASGVTGLSKNSSTSPYGGNNVLSFKMSAPISGWEA